jgi:hypothetical protein
MTEATSVTTNATKNEPTTTTVSAATAPTLATTPASSISTTADGTPVIFNVNILKLIQKKCHVLIYIYP